MMITRKATTKTRSHSFIPRGTVPNTFARNGIYKIKRCNPREMAMAKRSHGFAQGGVVRRLYSSDRAFKELNISIVASAERESVLNFTLVLWKNSHGS